MVSICVNILKELQICQCWYIKKPNAKSEYNTPYISDQIGEKQKQKKAKAVYKLESLKNTGKYF